MVAANNPGVVACAEVVAGEQSVLQYVVDNVPAWIFWKDRCGVFRGCNLSFAQLAGYRHPDEVVGRTDDDMPWREFAETYRAGDREVMARGEPVLNREELIAGEQGGKLVILTSKVPMRNEAGAVVGILGILFDITERKQIEVELGKARDAAEAAARARGTFIANVSHELRTPLTLILGPLREALADPALTAGTRAILDRVQRNGFRLYNLVNDVLDFAKADAGRTSVRRKAVDVVAMLRSLVEDMKPLARSRGIALGFAAPVDRLVVSLDPKLVERSVLNLVGNALKFTPGGGRVDLSLDVAVDASGARELRIDVRDTGIGIAPDDLQRLFQPFQQVDASVTRKHEGTGLGLALVKQFVEQLGGTVTVGSTVGEGSTFTVRLPALPVEATAAPRPSPDAEAGAPELGSAAWQRRTAMQVPAADARGRAADATRARILVADDNADMRAYIVEVLGAHFNVVSVEDGALAWEAVQLHELDAVVSDVMMPRLDGLELTGRIKADPRLAELPVILVTARGGSESAAAGLDSGADDYLVKPFAPEELLSRVRAAVRMRRMQRDLRRKARLAGMAEVATGVLHNVGNVLNGVSVSTSLLRSAVEQSRVELLERITTLLVAELRDETSRATFLTTDPRGRLIPDALSAVTAELTRERASLRSELQSLRESVDHIMAIVSSQQEFARRSNEPALVDLHALVDRAILLVASPGDPGVNIVRDFGALPAQLVDPHKLTEVLVNLLSNARDSVRERGVDPGVVSIRTWQREDGAAAVAISDNGVGIAAQHLPRVFEHGFTTKPAGHGFGLHISALAARELGGSLAAHSDGPGAGATFTVSLPPPPS